jgi:uncharacterized protein YyaL (SSP411 family)
MAEAPPPEKAMANQLASETSPYLLLHKDNPVHWHTWSEATLEEAREQNKPILLSVGYTACHWCHVMNEESFADPETAALMNALFVNIKVDREERPDLDLVYQTAAQALGNNGGWPLTVFLTPQGEPYFAGTYYPREERYGQPAFKRVLEEVARIYREQPDPVANTTARVQQTYAQLWGRDMRGPLDASIFDQAAMNIGRRFDIFFGGFTGAPKFPSFGPMEQLWRAYLRTGTEPCNQLVQITLTSLCMGGICDHLGGGIHRYATDERWLVPHFEKMLYDNAQFIDVLTLLWQHNRAPLYRVRLEETIDWLFREMMVEQGFASALDADSEGQEGKYYVWTEAEIDAALAGTFSQKFKSVYNVTRDGNWEGRNILHRLAPQSAFPQAEADEAMLKRQRELLLAARQKRVAPIRDDKVLADWNGMTIAALANAGAVFRNGACITAAVRAFDFVERALGDGDRLYHSWRNGQRQHTGFADDYAHMSRAALVLWEATADRRYLDRARAWVHVLNEHFWDIQNGGYFYTSDDSDPLIVRSRMIFDQATPAANGVMVSVLGKLYLATWDNAYRDRSNALVEACAGEAPRGYSSMSSYMAGLELIVTGLQIVIVGPLNNPKTHELISAVMGRSLPNRTLLLADPAQEFAEGHPAYGKKMENGQPTAYVCQRQTCSAPITNPVTLSQVLQLPQPRTAPGQTTN